MIRPLLFAAVRLMFGGVICLLSGAPLAAATVDLEDLPLAFNSFYNGDPGGLVPPATVNGSFTSRGASFANQFVVQQFGPFSFSFWDGFALSNKTDSVTPGFGNQYSAIAGGGFGGSSNYAIGFDSGGVFPTRVTLPAGERPLSVALTNTTYVYRTIADGNDGGANFARQFTAGDYLRLSVTGLDASDATTGILDFYLADYRDPNPLLRYALNNWQTLNLSGLPANTRKLEFRMTTTDVGPFGANTPLYFALDQLITASAAPVVVPEPAAFASALIFSIAGIAAGLAGSRHGWRERMGAGRSTRRDGMDSRVRGNDE